MVSSLVNSLTLSASLLTSPASMNEYQGENREEKLSRGIEVKLKYVPIVADFSLYILDSVRLQFC